ERNAAADTRREALGAQAGARHLLRARAPVWSRNRRALPAPGAERRLPRGQPPHRPARQDERDTYRRAKSTLAV
ncbi:MAG: hypothetical protein AVDCRST_MAG17-1498, partial [uncultured Solirubrobacterales bacterium]